MSIGYTREQIHQLDILLDNNVPPEQSPEQLETAVVVSEVVMAGTELGVLVRVGFGHGETRDYFLNCAVVLELVIGLVGASNEQNWWGVGEQPQFEPELPEVPRSAHDNAWRVLSLRTDSTPDGALISFSTGRTVSQFFMFKNIAHYVVGGLISAAERVGYWDDEMRLIPAHGERPS